MFSHDLKTLSKIEVDYMLKMSFDKNLAEKFRYSSILYNNSSWPVVCWLIDGVVCGDLEDKAKELYAITGISQIYINRLLCCFLPQIQNNYGSM